MRYFHSISLSRLSYHFWLAFLLVVLVTGCATRPLVPVLSPEMVEQRWALRQAQLTALEGWELGGRVAVKHTQDSWSASLRWQQQAEAFDISFSSMLGQRMAQLKGDASVATLYLPDERAMSAANLSELLGDELGWHVPMNELRYWLVGLPVPSMVLGKAREVAKGLDAQGRLQWLEQSGWRIEYARYRSVGVLEVPKKMVLTREGTRVRFVIDHWRAVPTLNNALSTSYNLVP